MNSQRYPLEHKLDCKNDAKREIRPVQYVFKRFVLVQIDVLEAQCHARCENQH